MTAKTTVTWLVLQGLLSLRGHWQLFPVGVGESIKPWPAGVENGLMGREAFFLRVAWRLLWIAMTAGAVLDFGLDVLAKHWELPFAFLAGVVGLSRERFGMIAVGCGWLFFCKKGWLYIIFQSRSSIMGSHTPILLSTTRVMECWSAGVSAGVLDCDEKISTHTLYSSYLLCRTCE